MSVQHHIVEKVRVDVNVNTMKTAEKVKSEISDFIQNEVLSILEAYLTGMSDDFDDSIIQLDKVSLSVDTSSWNVHSNSVKTELEDQVRKALDPIVKEAQKKISTQDKRERRNELLGSESSASTQVYGNSERIIRSFFHFLDHGTLPWWINSVEESRSMFSEKTLKPAIEENLAYVAVELNRRKGDLGVIDRLLKQYSSQFVAELVSIQILGSRQREVTSARVKMIRSAMSETVSLPKNIFRNVLQFSWKLDHRGINLLNSKKAKGLLFQQIKKHLFVGSEQALDLALKTTDGIVQFLNVSSRNTLQTVELRKELIKSIHKQVPQKVWRQILKTDTYINLFSPLKIQLEDVELDDFEKKSKLNNEERIEETISSKKEKKSEHALNEDNSESIQAKEVGKSESNKLASENDVSDANNGTTSSQKEDEKIEAEVSLSDTNSEVGNSSSNEENLDEINAHAEGNVESEAIETDVETPSTKSDSVTSEGELLSSESKSVEDQDSRKDIVKTDEAIGSVLEEKSSISPAEERKVEAEKKEYDSEGELNLDKGSKTQKTSTSPKKSEEVEISEDMTSDSDESDSRKKSAADREQSKSSSKTEAGQSKSSLVTETGNNASSLVEESRGEADKEADAIQSGKTEKSLGEDSIKDTESQLQPDPESPQGNEDEVDSLAQLKKAFEDSSKSEITTRAKKNYTMPNQLFVANAGLVLLNPFLPALFKELALVGDDGKLIDPELATCILHYAATGREGDFEFEMTFEKYLCGIPPSFSLRRDIILTQAQKDEVKKVLDSVLQHWTALKSRSPELLQNEFLKRSGKLIVEKSNHRLIVEKKTFDLLLDKLPWSYSLIKFSWKKEMMFVEW
ncbi:MAG: contractile injection system tape measure protein [Crocinitomicaceae bacterium]